MPDDLDELGEMIRVNVGESASQLYDAGFSAEQKIAVDGRMLPHEWIQTPRALIKTDTLDHHADDFFPGSRDIAWDVAGAIVELGLEEAAASYLVERYKMLSADRCIDQRLSFYGTAYLAYRIGYSTLAAETLGHTSDGVGFTALRERYRRLLAARVARRRSAPGC
jgi:hypothetical protein